MPVPRRKPQMLEANWIHPPSVERWLRRMSIGDTLNICCGKSKVGDIRIDLDPNAERNFIGDLFHPPFRKFSFDTVICDPPYSYFNKWIWVFRISDLARKRFLIASPNISVNLSRYWKRTFWFSDDHQHLWLRTYWCFDRKNEFITNYTPEG